MTQPSEFYLSWHELIKKTTNLDQKLLKDLQQTLKQYIPKPHYIIEEKQNGQWIKIAEKNNIVSLLENMKPGRRCIDTNDNYIVEW